ncbi:tRNA preQ1(34) S-adenosylmethionine ribosyltransferase-isomerase QueA [Methylophilaceae bacterium]|jgi:S-adenosylmethionine:tRNA ribosyltransferase-isomerase|nr:tRNA preQ1(34) S-adenosylmethionine ribosyltransferase-isomerase QueA [Methylophilaceae bacterium]|tara:strand:- start:878 stop:1915 length:1038 start_codon:yes stop_codon:yes gene_type:complete
MNIENFNYELPNKLIAQYPPKNRGGSKLLVANPFSDKLQDLSFQNFINLISPNDLIIFNNTKVIKARLFGQKETGGKIEILIEQVLSDQKALAMIKSSKKINLDLKIILSDEYVVKICERKENLFLIQLNQGSFHELMELNGHVPLPPYINRPDEIDDIERYQTVFAKNKGAIAAPTAGLHFSESDFTLFDQNKINFTFITLHVGSGTFQPVKALDINQHTMHSEQFEITEETKIKIELAKKNNGRIIAIGTTVLRALESSFIDNEISTGHQETKIFIKPGYKFKLVDSLFTNFHLPKSTLLMLVSAFAGYEFTKKMYSHAIKKNYRFFSYGDAMFIEQKSLNID